MKALWKVGFAVVAMCAVVGCEPQGPEEVALGYLEAMRDGKMRQAWERVSAQDQAAMPLRVLEAQREQAGEQVDGLAGRVGFEVLGVDASPESEEAVVRVQVLLVGAKGGEEIAGDVEEVRLRRESDTWRVDTEWAERQAEVLDRPEQGAPAR